MKRLFQIKHRELEGRRLADEAISYRNVGQFDKALDLLKSALYEYGYTPAITLWGTTLVMKGDIPGAIGLFSRAVEEQPSHPDYPLIEAYANLGSIYNQHVCDYAEALRMYEKGLAAPRLPGIGDEVYRVTATRVYADIALVYWNLEDLPRAKEYSLKCLADSASLDDVTRAKVHLRLGRILLEMGECPQALNHAKMGIKSFDDAKNSKEYCVVAFSSLYGGCLFRRCFEHSEPFPDLEDIVSRLEVLHMSKPGDAENLFLLAASYLCLALSEYQWRDAFRRETMIRKFLLYRKAYDTLKDSAERTRLLSKMTVEMLSEKTGLLFDPEMFDNFFSGLGFPIRNPGFAEHGTLGMSPSRIPPTRVINESEGRVVAQSDSVSGHDPSRGILPAPGSCTAEDNNESARLSLLAGAAFTDPDAARRKQAQDVLLREFPRGREGFEEFLSKLIENLIDPQGYKFASGILRMWGEMALPYLEPLLASDDMELRKAVVHIVTLMGEDNRLLRRA